MLVFMKTWPLIYTRKSHLRLCEDPEVVASGFAGVIGTRYLIARYLIKLYAPGSEGLCNVVSDAIRLPDAVQMKRFLSPTTERPLAQRKMVIAWF